MADPDRWAIPADHDRVGLLNDSPLPSNSRAMRAILDDPSARDEVGQRFGPIAVNAIMEDAEHPAVWPEEAEVIRGLIRKHVPEGVLPSWARERRSDTRKFIRRHIARHPESDGMK